MSKLAKICVVVLCGITAVLCASCENLFSIEYRIVKSWQVSHTYLNDEEIDSTVYLGYAPETYYYIYADHVMAVMARYQGEYRESSFATWVADEKKKTVHFQYTFYGKEYDFTAKILKLTRNEFLIEFTDEKGDHWKLQMFSRSNY